MIKTRNMRHHQVKRLLFLSIFIFNGFSLFPQEKDEYQLFLEDFKKAQREFLNGDFESFINFYEKNGSRVPGGVSGYKMAYLSYLQKAAANPVDSITFMGRADKAYANSIRWNGLKMTKESWDSLEFNEGYHEKLNMPEMFTLVDEQPEPFGGFTSFYKYIANTLVYPKEARRLGIEGQVFVQFIVNKDGSLDGVTVVKGIGGGCDEAAAQVITEASAWKPGKVDGRPVYVRMILPITFKLSKKKKRRKK